MKIVISIFLVLISPLFISSCYYDKEDLLYGNSNAPCTDTTTVMLAFYKKYPAYRDSVIRYMAEEMGALNKKNKAMTELEKYAPVLSELKQLEQEQARIHDQISLDKERLKQLNATYSVPFTALHLIEAADVPVQKSRPKSAIIVLIASLCGIMLSILAVFVIDNLKNSENRRTN